MKRILLDSHVRIDINMGWRSNRDPEQWAKWLEEEAKSVKEFIRDHKSMDINDVYVVREYGYKCEFCGWSYDLDKEPERADCCEDQIRTWATAEELIELGIEEITYAKR